ncbi:rhomboid family intramembrane serine protease, partial [Dietzia sp. SLG510A3-30A2]|nr:rhomboid family intramembrane serine protease [Dietzia sp. SLG510A3-30A2]
PRRVGRTGRQVVSWAGFLVVVGSVGAAGWFAADTMTFGFLVTR